MKKLYLLVLLVLLIVPLAIAEPPFQESIVTAGTLDIRFPQVQSVKINSVVTAHTHVFNATNELPMTNETVDCIMHLYNSSGNQILLENMDFDGLGQDFELEINASIFSTLGHHAFLLQCNATTAGGFVSGSFRVTADGEDDSKLDTSSGISATIFILFIVTLLFVMPFVKQFSKFEWSNNIIKRAFWTVGTFVLMWNSSILSTIADNANLDIVSHLLRYMIMFGWAGYLLAGYMVLKSLFEILGAWKIKKEKKRYGGNDDEQ